MKKLITVIIPAFNEAESLSVCIRRVTKLIDSIKDYDFEILLVDDGSKDTTATLIKKQHTLDNRFSYLTLSRNFGKETAMMAGMDYARGDAVIFMDADLQDPPELIPEMLKYWEQGFDDVYARRRSRKGETWLKKWTSKLYYRVLQSFTSVDIQKDTGDFRLLDRRCINALTLMRESCRNSKSMFSWIGYKKKAILYDRDPRVAGKTKWHYMRLIDLAIDGITSFTTSPLRLAAYLAIPTVIMFVAYFIYVIIKCFVVQMPVQAFQAIILIVLFFSCVNILLFGIMGEYLGRIFKESKGRPLYLIDEYNGKKELNEVKPHAKNQK